MSLNYELRLDVSLSSTKITVNIVFAMFYIHIRWLYNSSFLIYFLRIIFAWKNVTNIIKFRKSHTNKALELLFVSIFFYTKLFSLHKNPWLI